MPTLIPANSLRTLTHFFTSHGLPLLFAVIMLESFGIPLPGETALIAFGVLASQGHYSIVVVIAVAAAAAIVGDNLGYELNGRKGGRRLLERWEPLRRRAERILPPTEELMAKHGGKVVFFGRFITILRYTAAWVAGIAGMPWRKFLFWNAAGGICWATLVGLGRTTRAAPRLTRSSARDLRGCRRRRRGADLLRHSRTTGRSGSKTALGRGFALACALRRRGRLRGGSVGATVPKVAPPSVRVPDFTHVVVVVFENDERRRSPATPTRRPSTRSRAATRH
jgi:membrane protein DedA with SNARE-associated domain